MSAIHFLVADTSPAVQTFLRQLLESYGFEPAWVKTASSSQAALEIAAEHRPHVLLSDCFSRDALTGLALHQHVLQYNPQCQFGLMSAQLDATLTQQAQRAGALFYLRKPFTASEIKGAMAKAMEKLAETYPPIARMLHPTSAQAARQLIPVMPKFKDGDTVIYQGRQDTVKHVIFRRGELVVQLRGTLGMVEAYKLKRV